MLRWTRLVSLLIFGTAVALGLVGCGGGSRTNPNTTISVVIYPGAPSIPVSGVINFTAVVYNFTQNGAVTWKASAGTFNGSTFTASSSTGNVTVTATSQEDTTKSATVTVMVTAAQPLAVSPAAIALNALGTQQFTASGNGPFMWTVSASSGADPGVIDQSGNYTAPRTPPPGGTVTVSVTSGANAGTATVTILYAAATLLGQYSFSYAGEDAGGFLAVAGTFTTDGTGAITSGVEDVNSAATGISENTITSGSFTVGPDGRTIASVTTSQGTVTWQVTIISQQHSLLVRFDSAATGSGTIDLATPADFSVSAITNNYAFGISGIDSGGFPMAIAGRFFSDGAGTFPVNSAIQDVNDGGGKITTADTSLHGSIMSLDSGTGRGTLEFISTAPGTGTLTFAFYVVDSTHFKLVEIDVAGNPVLAGDAFSAPNSITLASLNGSYAFTVAGAQTAGPYAAGGVFTASGSGMISGGVQDLNEQANVLHMAQKLTSSSTYTLNPTTTSNRILLTLNNGTTNFMYAVYPGSNNSVEMVEIDNAILISSGMGFLQSSTNSPAGTYGLNTTGQTTSGEQDINGSIAAAGTALIGYLDINETGNIFLNTPLAGSSIVAPATFGRGTLTLATAKPTSASFAFSYYIVDDSTVLVLELDKVAVTLGTMAKQF
jgi:hypothetical protein